MLLSHNPDEVLVTYSLGSCVGLTLYDPALKLGGMIHCMLPLSSLNPEKAKSSPEMFVDSGVAELLRQMYGRGAEKRRLVDKLAGAGAPLDDNGTFRIGERNLKVVRQMLANNGIAIRGESVGGTIARTMYLYLGDGRTVIKSRGQETEL